MKTIEIEDSVYSALETFCRFGERPNDTLKRILVTDIGQKGINDTESQKQQPPAEHPIMRLVQSPEYLRGNAKDRYFDVLRFLYQANPKEFEKLNGFRKGYRVQISREKSAVLQSGTHSAPQELDQTPYWVSTNNSTGRKQTLLEDIMRLLECAGNVIAAVVASIRPVYSKYC